MKSFAKLFSPKGILRASINVGNPILANLNPAGKPVGISVDLATELAQQLGLPLELVVFDSAGKSVDTVTQEKADVGFFAIDPARKGLHFTAPYLLISGSYIVRTTSPLKNNSEVDKKGTRLVVSKDSAYDLYLTRVIKNATIVRAPTCGEVVDTFLNQGYEVAGGVT